MPPLLVIYASDNECRHLCYCPDAKRHFHRVKVFCGQGAVKPQLERQERRESKHCQIFEVCREPATKTLCAHSVSRQGWRNHIILLTNRAIPKAGKQPFK